MRGMQVPATGALMLALAGAASSCLWQERNIGAQSGNDFLVTRFRGQAVVFGRGSAETRRGETPLVSLGELTVWRSPRGLEWREEGNHITFWSHDRAAKATLDYRTGAVLSASGLFRSWRGRRLQRLVVENGEGMFFGNARADFLAKPQWMSAYFGDYARIDATGIRLSTYPCFMGWNPKVSPYPDKVTEITFAAADLDVDGLQIQIVRPHLLAYTREGLVVGGVLEFNAILTNTGRSARLVQPARLSPKFGRSVLCLTGTASGSVDYESADVKWVHGGTTGGGGFPKSFVLAPGDRVELSARSFAAFEQTPDVVDKLGMVYWDGARRIAFSLFARKRLTVEYPPVNIH